MKVVFCEREDVVSLLEKGVDVCALILNTGLVIHCGNMTVSKLYECLRILDNNVRFYYTEKDDCQLIESSIQEESLTIKEFKELISWMKDILGFPLSRMYRGEEIFVPSDSNYIESDPNPILEKGIKLGFIQCVGQRFSLHSFDSYIRSDPYFYSVTEKGAEFLSSIFNININIKL